MAGGIVHGYGTAHCLPDQVKPVQSQPVNDLLQIVGEIVQRPGKTGIGTVRPAHSPHVETDHAVVARDGGHPPEPHAVVLGHPVVHQDRIRFRPRVGEIVNGVIQLGSVVQAEFHRSSSPLVGEKGIQAGPPCLLSCLNWRPLFRGAGCQSAGAGVRPCSINTERATRMAVRELV